MSRTLGQLDLGTSVWIAENSVMHEYILMSKDSAGCIMLRANVVEARRMNPTSTAVYEGSEMDNWVTNDQSGFLSRFDADTLAVITSRSRPTYSYGDTECHYISRRAFLLTRGELFLSAPTALEPLKNITYSLMAWKGTDDPSTARIGTNEELTAVYWWLSSPSSAPIFLCVSANGTSSASGADNVNYWARPALNVSADTIVSDEGAETIYLLPSKGYREVSFHGKVGEDTNRPSTAVVDYEAVNLYDVVVEICNNYGDAFPVWVPCTSGQQVTLANESKQTDNWQIGVRCYGKSQSYGYFNEPIVKWR
jgi:hypothetical protein